MPFNIPNKYQEYLSKSKIWLLLLLWPMKSPTTTQCGFLLLIKSKAKKTQYESERHGLRTKFAASAAFFLHISIIFFPIASKISFFRGKVLYTKKLNTQIMGDATNRKEHPSIFDWFLLIFFLSFSCWHFGFFANMQSKLNLNFYFVRSSVHIHTHIFRMLREQKMFNHKKIDEWIWEILPQIWNNFRIF